MKMAAFGFATLMLGAACSHHPSVLLESGGSIQEARTQLGPSREFNYFASGRDLYTEIHGNPFDVPDATFQRRVTDILNARNSLVPTNFTVEPGPSADPAFRAVVVFNRADHYSGFDLCRGPGVLRTGPHHGDRIKVDMAFCNGRDELHSVSGTLPMTASPADPEFENALALTLALAQPMDEPGEN